MCVCALYKYRRIYLCRKLVGYRKRKDARERKSVEIHSNRGLVFFSARDISACQQSVSSWTSVPFSTTVTTPHGDEKLEVISFTFSLLLSVSLVTRSAGRRCNKRVNSFKGVTIKCREDESCTADAVTLFSGPFHQPVGPF